MLASRGWWPHSASGVVVQVLQPDAGPPRAQTSPPSAAARSNSHESMASAAENGGPSRPLPVSGEWRTEPTCACAPPIGLEPITLRVDLDLVGSGWPATNMQVSASSSHRLTLAIVGRRGWFVGRKLVVRCWRTGPRRLAVASADMPSPLHRRPRSPPRLTSCPPADGRRSTHVRWSPAA